MRISPKNEKMDWKKYFAAARVKIFLVTRISRNKSIFFLTLEAWFGDES